MVTGRVWGGHWEGVGWSLGGCGVVTRRVWGGHWEGVGWSLGRCGLVTGRVWGGHWEVWVGHREGVGWSLGGCGVVMGACGVVTERVWKVFYCFHFHSTAHSLKDALTQLEELTSTWPKEPSLYISKGKVRKQ